MWPGKGIEYVYHKQADRIQRMRALKMKNKKLNYSLRTVVNKDQKNKARQQVANNRLRDHKGRLVGRTMAKVGHKESKIAENYCRLKAVITDIT